MTTNTDGAMPELPEAEFPHNIGTPRYTADQMREYARAAIQQAAGAVPEGLAELVQSCRGSVKSDLSGFEQLLLRKHSPAVEEEVTRLQAILDSIDALAGREAGSSDHLAPCAGGGVTQPLTLAQIQTLYQQVQAEVAKLEDEGRYTFAGWFPVAVRLIEAAVWEAKK